MPLPLTVIPDAPPAQPTSRKPSWLKMKVPHGVEYSKLLRLVNDHRLHTVCQSAKCPNMGECWAAGTATLMILGDVCTRSCGFCHIATGRPPTLDLDEPARVGQAVATMNLKHTVVTSVNRDELPDGGASVWAETIRQIRLQSPGTSVEVLIPRLEVVTSMVPSVIRSFEPYEPLELTRNEPPPEPGATETVNPAVPLATAVAALLYDSVVSMLIPKEEKLTV